MMLVFYMCRLSCFSSRSSLGYYKFKYEKPRSANSLLLFHLVECILGIRRSKFGSSQ